MESIGWQCQRKTTLIVKSKALIRKYNDNVVRQRPAIVLKVDEGRQRIGTEGADKAHLSRPEELAMYRRH